MIKLFLKAKHWKLFVLGFALPMVIHITSMGLIFTHMNQSANPDPSVFMSYFRFFPVLIILFAGVQFGWMWSAGIGLKSYIPEHLQPNTGFFRFALLYPLVYMITFSIIITGFFSNVFGDMANTLSPVIGNPDFFPVSLQAAITVIIPMHLFAMVCIVYCLYFVAKTIKTAEKHEILGFGDFVGEFFLIWFFPIGIWILQPRINKIVMKENDEYIA